MSDTLAITAFGRGGGQANQGIVFARLVPIGDRAHSQADSRDDGAAADQAIPERGAIVAVQGSSSSVFQRGSGPGGGGIQYALSDRIWRSSISTRRRPSISSIRTRAIVDITRSYVPGRPELRVVIDRKRAADLGIRVEDVSQTVNALMAGQRVTTFNAASDQYDVMLKAQDAFRRAPETLAAATVRGPASGELVQLRNLVTLDQGVGPASIDR